MLHIIEHFDAQWGNSNVIEIICPHCSVSIIDEGVVEDKCYSCKNPIPKLWRHFRERKTARFMYYRKTTGA